MQSEESPYRLMFFEAFSDAFLRDAMQCVRLSYEQTGQDLIQWPWPQRKDLRPYLRRANIEANLHSLAQRYENIEASVSPNDAGNCSHLRLRSGAVFLTESKVESPSAVVRPAGFRKRYSRFHQLSMFPEDNEVVPQDDDLYAVLLHGPDDRDQDVLGFLSVGFPTPEFDGYWDVFSLAAHLQQSAGYPEPEIVDDDLTLHIRHVPQAGENRS
jgi:hypothetical protein